VLLCDGRFGGVRSGSNDKNAERYGAKNWKTHSVLFPNIPLERSVAAMIEPGKRNLITDVEGLKTQV
jgi:hypothetical protein